MARNWTEEQRAAFELTNRNILVAAAAGSGKTAVLVERIIRKITDATHPVNVDELVGRDEPRAHAVIHRDTGS